MWHCMDKQLMNSKLIVCFRKRLTCEQNWVRRISYKHMIDIVENELHTYTLLIHSEGEIGLGSMLD